MNRRKGIFITLGLVVAISGGTLIFKTKTKPIETANTPETVVSDASTNTDSEEPKQDTEDSSGHTNKTSEAADDRTNPITEYEVTDDGYVRVKKISESEAVALCDKRLKELDYRDYESPGSVINTVEEVYYQVVYPDSADAYAVHMYTGEVFYSGRDGISNLQ